jgi:hypothetical protein
METVWPNKYPSHFSQIQLIQQKSPAESVKISGGPTRKAARSATDRRQYVSGITEPSKGGETLLPRVIKDHQR